MRLPDWLRKKGNVGDHVHELKKDLRRHGLHTVCEEARCPNLCECFAKKTATFMIMGNICTRSCGFCAVKNGTPKPLDPNEPKQVARQAAELGLKHVVVTSVTRDDLKNGGANHFAHTIQEIRKTLPAATIEVLTPDFLGEAKTIETVLNASPDVFNHNLETVERLTPNVRSKASYERSLDILKMAARSPSPRPSPTRGEGKAIPSPLRGEGQGGGDRLLIKSGLMVGLGETTDEIKTALKDLKTAGCDIVTIGQYLRPTKNALPVHRYIPPKEFEKYKAIGEELGIKHMFCGPFVRSSYMAGELLHKK